MRRSARVLGVRIAAVWVVCVLVASGAAAQGGSGGTDAEAGWQVPRTAWGAPDLQGVWDYRTMTPLQRPREFAGKTVMSEEEAAAFTARTLEEQADYDPAPRPTQSQLAPTGQLCGTPRDIPTAATFRS